MSEAAQSTATLAEGASARILDAGDGTILKVYRGDLGTLLQKREFHYATLAHAGGLPTPKPLERLDVDGAPALRFEHFEGTGLDSWTLPRFWNWRRASRTLAELHARMHVLAAEESYDILHPTQDQLYRFLISECAALDDATRAACLAPLEDPSRRRRLCHGDFSPANVMTDGRTHTIVDWSLASTGDPILDVAFTWVGIRELPERLDLSPTLRRVLRYGSEIYLQTYLAMAERAPTREQIVELLPTAAAARLGALERADGPAAERAALVGLIGEALA